MSNKKYEYKYYYASTGSSKQGNKHKVERNYAEEDNKQDKKTTEIMEQIKKYNKRKK